jgi:hypothetical protein
MLGGPTYQGKPGDMATYGSYMLSTGIRRMVPMLRAEESCNYRYRSLL